MYSPEMLFKLALTIISVEGTAGFFACLRLFYFPLGSKQSIGVR